MEDMKNYAYTLFRTIPLVSHLLFLFGVKAIILARNLYRFAMQSLSFYGAICMLFNRHNLVFASTGCW